MVIYRAEYGCCSRNVHSVSIKPETGNPSAQVNSKGLKVKPTTAVYWLRFLMAILAGSANEFLHISSTQPNWGNFAQLAGIGLGACFYLLSILIVRFVFRYGEAELKGKHKYITLGGGTFIVLWVMVLVLVNSLRPS